jgi:hypothetical protein
MMSLPALLEILFLITAANGAPVLAARLCGDSFGYPVDFGLRMPDGRRVLGSSKTWRGLLAALVATPVAAGLIGLPAQYGLLAAAAAMAGDLFSSFSKRRLGLQSSDMALGLDQLPEALFPTLVLMGPLELSAAEAAAAVFLFFALEIPLSMLLFRLGLRKRPY